MSAQVIFVKSYWGYVLDIKPSNLLLKEGKFYVGDFGLSTSSLSTAGIRGTQGFIAPEVLEGDASSSASDIYAIGKVLEFILDHVEEDISPNCSDFLDMTLKVNPLERITEFQILAHPFLSPYSTWDSDRFDLIPLEK